MSLANNYVNSENNMEKDIFDGIHQTTVKIEQYDCAFPVFYYGKRALIGIFPARSGRIKKKAPDARFKPIEIIPGVSVVAVVAFDFDTSIGPVHEFYVGIPVKQPGKLLLGLGALQEMLEGYMPTWTMHLPVSTDIAYRCGVAGWGFPKTLADIPIIDNPDGTIRSEVIYNGEVACRLTGSIKAGKLNRRLTVKNLLWQEGSPQSCDHVFDLKGMAMSVTGDVKLETLSDAPIAKDLDDILISKKAIASIYVPELKALLCEPDRTPPVLLRKLSI